VLAPPGRSAVGEARHGAKYSRAWLYGLSHPDTHDRQHPIAALRHKEVAAYTDLLLHDMGPELGAGDICFGLATPSEFRTER